MVSKIQLRRGSAAEWVLVNPVLSLGEGGVEVDTGKVKFGDGLKAWTELRYSDDEYEYVDGPVTTVNGRAGDVRLTPADFGLENAPNVLGGSTAERPTGNKLKLYQTYVDTSISKVIFCVAKNPDVWTDINGTRV